VSQLSPFVEELRKALDGRRWLNFMIAGGFSHAIQTWRAAPGVTG